MRSAFFALLVASCASTTAGPRPPKLRPAPAKPAVRSHVVQEGENLYRIALRHGVSVEALAAANRLEDPTKLKVGQTLMIPSNGGPPEAPPEAPPREETPPTKDPLVRPARPTVGACGDAPRSEAKPSKSGWIWPVDGVVVSRYGTDDGQRHDGIDIGAPHGTPIWAARAGRVLFAGEQEGYGRLVIVRHDDDRVSIYAHNAKNCVTEGTRVEAGDVVGLVGDSGGSASPKVHFEVRQAEKAVNPRGLLP